MTIRPFFPAVLCILLFNLSLTAQSPQRKILVFSKVTNYYHESIPAGIAALMKIGSENGVGVDTTTNAAWFTEETLKEYAAVVFLNTSGNNLLDTVQRAELERYIQAGGGYVGVHCSAASEYNWPWFGRLNGGFFDGHPKPQEAVVVTADRRHGSTRHLPKRWKHFDEWYNYRDEPAGRNILLRVDESSYEGGTDGPEHPIAWWQDFDGGRSFYTGLGHTNEVYSDKKFLRHLAGGLKYAMGPATALDYSKARTAKVVLPVARVLVLSKTRGWKHTSIPYGIAAIQQLGKQHRFLVDTTTAATLINEENLKKYHAVIFNNTTGDIFDADQRTAFERYIQAGGGFVGIHAAADTEHNWPWYDNLVGGHFESHPNNPNVRQATIDIIDSVHPAGSKLPAKWVRNDEWYNYKSIYQGIKVIGNLDERTYEGGTHGGRHPIIWYHEYDGGRAFYTGCGHTDESFGDSLFLEHLLGGIHYAVGNITPPDFSKSYAKTAPDQGRFVKTVLAGNMASPMELSVTGDGRIFYTELAGKLSVYDMKTRKARLMHHFPVSKVRGLGLIGITTDPQFDTNGYVYLYYAPDGYSIDSLRFRLSRFTVSKNSTIDVKSEKILLSVHVQADAGAHYGGSFSWDISGNLFLSTGDGTSPFPSNGYAPLDQRAGKQYYSLDAQRSAANTNSLQGKILRIRPQDDGTYTIPKGNLFEPGTPLTRPEIYVMGVRNPYRLAVNPRTGVLYWGDIGPDAGNDAVQGPKGYDELNQAKAPGNFGWPYFIADNKAYPDWDFTVNKPGQTNRPEAPVNKSINNTGRDTLPPVNGAMIWYPYAFAPEFPDLGSGGRCIIAGDFYRYPAGGSANKFPEYYDGHLFIADWMRNWIKTVEVDSDEKLKHIGAFMTNSGDFRRPIDIQFGKDGIMYMLEYGSVYGADNDDARLVKVEYFTGNRPPVAAANIVDRELFDSVVRTSFLTSEIAARIAPKKEISGRHPLTVKFSGRTSTDPDYEDRISYLWKFTDSDSAIGAEPEYTFREPGIYKVVLKVSDREGLSASDTVIVKAGNTRPKVSITSSKNLSFAKHNDVLDYKVAVTDPEDGKVDPRRVRAYYLYNPLPGSNAFDFREVRYPGKELMDASDCKSCHLTDRKAVGPSYVAIANRYKSQSGSIDRLAAKIISGGGGNWGTSVMSAHPQVTQRQAVEMVRYIYSLTDKKPAQRSIPPSGKLKLTFSENEPRGAHNIVAIYTDNGLPATGRLSDTVLVSVRNHRVKTVYTDEQFGFPRFEDNLSAGSFKSYIALRNVDLNAISKFSFIYSAQRVGGIFEVRLDSRAGPVIASADFPATGAWKITGTVSASLAESLTGRHDLYFYIIRREPPFESIAEFKEIIVE